MATTQSTTTQTNRSAGAKKAAATRSAAARKRSAAAKKAAATRAENNRTPVDYATEYAEKAVLIPLGAGLVARDRCIAAPPDQVQCQTSQYARVPDARLVLAKHHRHIEPALAELLFQKRTCALDEMQAYTGHMRPHGRGERAGVARHGRRQQADQHFANRLSARSTDVIDQRLGVVGEPGHAWQQLRAELGQHDATTRPNEQPLAALAFQMRDRATHHRLRHAQGRCSLAQASGGSDTQEDLPTRVDDE